MYSSFLRGNSIDDYRKLCICNPSIFTLISNIYMCVQKAWISTIVELHWSDYYFALEISCCLNHAPVHVDSCVHLFSTSILCQETLKHHSWNIGFVTIIHSGNKEDVATIYSQFPPQSNYHLQNWFVFRALYESIYLFRDKRNTQNF